MTTSHPTQQEQHCWYVYIILNNRGKFYTGITTDIERRFKEHLASSKGAKFFRTGAPVKILYQQKFFSKSEALKREHFLKSLKRKDKEKLVQNFSFQE